MTRDVIQRAAKWRAESLQALFPHEVVFRGARLTGRLNPLTISAELLTGGNSITVSSVCYLRMSDLSIAGLQIPEEMERIEVDGKRYTVAYHSENPVLDEVTLHLSACPV